MCAKQKEGRFGKKSTRWTGSEKGFEAFPAGPGWTRLCLPDGLSRPSPPGPGLTLPGPSTGPEAAKSGHSTKRAQKEEKRGRGARAAGKRATHTAGALKSEALNGVDCLERPGGLKRPSGPWVVPASHQPCPPSPDFGPQNVGFSTRRRPKPYPVGPSAGLPFPPSPALCGEPPGRSGEARAASRGVER